MKYLVIIQAIIILCSCNSSKQTSTDIVEVQEPKLELEIELLTQQDSYPGVHSNLRMVRNFKLELGGGITEKIVFTNLLIDSVKVPLASMKIGDEEWGKLGRVLEGNYTSIQFTASRNYYDNSATTEFIMDPIIYELSGLELEKGIAKIEYLYSGEAFQYNLGAITKLDSQYHP